MEVNDFNNNSRASNPNPQSPRDYSLSSDARTRKTLYLIGSIFLILTCVGAGLAGLICLLYYFIFDYYNVSASEYLAMVQLAYLVVAIIAFSSLVWMIPMTIWGFHCYYQVGQSNEKKHLAFGICALLFCNLVTGILVIIGSNSMNNSSF